ncbi:2-polyprenyl-6-methoxyphenol hydroxylase [Dyella sp. OK004]|uniref:FAD binding domain-containing protein n=1 Tax=Dyella sp. OK004 TaxID=1855292 RepID=UPI0008EFE90A|nr:FAD-dependent monooxygenase [Dyella sp. OK004]SFS20063.1 2-polyprenyl-6-methoxyphenol hydroxylase [Dyella sp. OK004]
MSLRIGIAGGSVGGLFAAVLLARQGHQVTVMERARHGLARRGAGLVVQEQVERILRMVGLPRVAETGVWANERIVLDLRGHVATRERRPQMQMSWDLLYDGFRQLLPDSLYLTGATVNDIEPSDRHVNVTLADGRRFEFDLLIGADGQGSIVRSIVNGEAAKIIRPDYVGYAAWRGLVAENAMPRQAADLLFERFAFHFAEGEQALGYLVPGPDGQTAMGERRYNWVWYRQLPAEQLRELLSDAQRTGALSLGPGELPPAVSEALVADAQTQLPPPFAAAVAAEAQPFVQPIYDYESPRMVNRRVVLLGDAAFVARPHTAMGVAKAAGDAMALANALVGRPLDEALAAYEQARLSQGRAIVDYGRRLGQSLSMPVTP